MPKSRRLTQPARPATVWPRHPCRAGGPPAGQGLLEALEPRLLLDAFPFTIQGDQFLLDGSPVFLNVLGYQPLEPGQVATDALGQARIQDDLRRWRAYRGGSDPVVIRYYSQPTAQSDPQTLLNFYNGLQDLDFWIIRDVYFDPDYMAADAVSLGQDQIDAVLKEAEDAGGMDRVFAWQFANEFKADTAPQIAALEDFLSQMCGYLKDAMAQTGREGFSNWVTWNSWPPSDPLRTDGNPVLPGCMDFLCYNAYPYEPVRLRDQQAYGDTGRPYGGYEMRYKLQQDTIQTLFTARWTPGLIEALQVGDADLGSCESTSLTAVTAPWAMGTVQYRWEASRGRVTPNGPAAEFYAGGRTLGPATVTVIAIDACGNMDIASTTISVQTSGAATVEVLTLGTTIASGRIDNIDLTEWKLACWIQTQGRWVQPYEDMTSIWVRGDGYWWTNVHNANDGDLYVYAVPLDYVAGNLGTGEEPPTYLATAQRTSVEDGDNDLLPDDWETTELGGTGLGRWDDPDSDKADNLEEFLAGTGPATPDNDTDGDGIWDNLERNYFGRLDFDGTADPDFDGLDNQAEQLLGTHMGQPSVDRDQDGLPDAWEIRALGGLGNAPGDLFAGGPVTVLDAYELGYAPMALTAPTLVTAGHERGTGYTVTWSGGTADLTMNLWQCGPTGWVELAADVPALNGRQDWDTADAAAGWYALAMQAFGGAWTGEPTCAPGWVQLVEPSPPPQPDAGELWLMLEGAPSTFTGKFDAPDFYQISAAYDDNGEMHCVPVSAADGVVWLAEHGFPALPARASQVAMVNSLASYMNTNGVQPGTLWEDGAAGWRSFLEQYYDPVHVNVALRMGHASGGEFPGQNELDLLGQEVSRSDTVAIVAGELWLYIPGDGWSPYGGHAVFLAGYDMTGADPIVHVCDPSTNGSPQIEPNSMTWVPGEGYYTANVDTDAMLADLGIVLPPGGEAEVRWVGAITAQIVLSGGLCLNAPLVAEHADPGDTCRVAWTCGSDADTLALRRLGPTGWVEQEATLPVSDGCYYWDTSGAADAWYTFAAQRRSGEAWAEDPSVSPGWVRVA